MNRLTRCLVISSALISASSVQAGFFESLDLTVGVDYYHAWRKIRNNFSFIYPKSYPGATIYIQSRFTDCLGFELGFDSSVTKTKNWTIPAGTTIGGITTTTPFSGSTRIRFSGLHLDLLGYMPIDNCFELFGAIGYGSAGLRLGVGGNYMLTDCIGLRGKVGYEYTNNVRVMGNTVYNNIGFPNKLRCSAGTFSLGAFVKF